MHKFKVDTNFRITNERIKSRLMRMREVKANRFFTQFSFQRRLSMSAIGER